METKFSIITASYNYEDYIKETIESVINQTYQNWEMIIVDDGSKDNSIEVIEQYCQKDSRIKLFTHENNQNKGLVETIKLGMEKAENDWVVFLESDDTITPNYLEKKLEIIKENNDVKFIFNAVNMFGDNERIEQYKKHFERMDKILKENPYPKNQLKFFKKENIVATFSCVAMKKELFNGLDFNSPIKAFLDYYLWMQIAQKTSLYYINENLTNWRMHQSYITRKENSPYEKTMFRYKRAKILHPNLAFLIKLTYPLWILTYLRRMLIKFRPSEKKLYILGKEIKFKEKNND